MQYRYRVEGKVEKVFILRGAYFPIGRTIEFYVTENELLFVKQNCTLSKVIDLCEKPKATDSISTVATPKKKRQKRAKK